MKPRKTLDTTRLVRMATVKTLIIHHHDTTRRDNSVAASPGASLRIVKLTMLATISSA